MAQQSGGLDDYGDDLEGDFPTSVGGFRKGTSASGRLSIRSESNAGDENWQVDLSPKEDRVASQAISAAQNAGIPLPQNVPASALVGGSIKRLGKKTQQYKITNEDWADDLDIGNAPLQVKKRDHATLTPADEMEDLDWGEGSLGIRQAGTIHDNTNRGSSASMISPSMGSIKTNESEEDGMGGLILPSGPLNFDEALHKRQKIDNFNDGCVTSSGKVLSPNKINRAPGTAQDDFLADIDFGDGDVFDPKKTALHRNVKAGQRSTHQPNANLRTQTTLTFNEKHASTRIPRPVFASRPNRLEPVFEAGATSGTRYRRPEPTTTNAQLLRAKRSAPALRNQAYGPSRGPISSPISFMPGPDPEKSHRVRNQASQPHLRHGQDQNRSQSPPLRSISRLSGNNVSPETPSRARKDAVPGSLAREAAGKRTLTRPTRRRQFGDGSELEIFDDLPTSAVKESKFVKQPSSKPTPKALRTQPSQSRLGQRDKMTTPLPATPKSPVKEDCLPRFARDTAASRIAREAKLGFGARPRDGPAMPRTNWVAQVAARNPYSSPTAHRQPRKGPTLINPMGKENVKQFQDDAAKKGMRWNATLCKWEGNESEILQFEAIAPPSPPRPALISNMASTQGVQVVGGMVFDPQRMCWLKMNATPSLEEDEDDPFKDIPDLPESAAAVDSGAFGGVPPTITGGDWLVGEEFDLGPEFIRRQREEEVIWRSRVGAWFGEDRAREGDSYFWAIRDIAAAATQQ